MSASTGHLRPGSAGEARRRAFALALPVLGVLALIATLPVGGAAIAVGAARLRRHLRRRAAARPAPGAARGRRTGPGAARPRAIDAVEAPARALSLVAFVAIVWFIPIRVYTLPAPGPVKLEPYRLMVILLAVALLLGAISGARRIRTCGVGGALLTLSASAVISLAVNYSSFTERALGTEATKAATYLLTFPIVFVLVASGVRSRADVERCLKAIIVGGAVVAFCRDRRDAHAVQRLQPPAHRVPVPAGHGRARRRGAQRRAPRRGLRAAPDRARRRARARRAALARDGDARQGHAAAHRLRRAARCCS